LGEACPPPSYSKEKEMEKMVTSNTVGGPHQSPSVNDESRRMAYDKNKKKSKPKTKKK
jgi:hypothetical protein|tara:strand:+ start:420 stop:593 length:174 start_codon:yes stop_codon:yes gene_type:complete